MPGGGWPRLARVAATRRWPTRLEDAAELHARFEAAFWVEDLRYYAMALDGDKRQADAIGSNAGQCLWSGIVAPERARDVVERLLRPELFCGWGIRTYASGQPGYNPIGYHTGTVWPHDTSLIAAGLKRYGFDDASNRLAGRVFEAAQQFPDFRLPGAVLRLRPRPRPCPGALPGRLLAAGLGGRGVVPVPVERCSGCARMPNGAELELSHPHHLPEWLGRVTLRDLRVGEASVDLLFHRWRGTTSAEVLRKVGDVAVTVRL